MKSKYWKIAGAVGLLAVAALIGCAQLEDRLGDKIGDENAAIVVDTACVGATAFADQATEGLSPILAAVVKSGINKSCAARKNVSAVVLDTPLATFCRNAKPLTVAQEPDAGKRLAFNGALVETCEREAPS